MKKRLTLIGILAVALVFVVSGTAVAQKIGFINMRAIMSQSDAGKKAEAELKKFVEKKKADIAKKEEELKKLKDELEKQKSVLTAEAYREKEASYQVKVQDANEEVGKKEQVITGVMIPDILKIVEQVGKQGKYDAILDLNNPVVVYHDKEDNLTKKIIEEYNKGAGKSAPAPAKGKK
jgi:outer membrane protein